VTYGGMMFLPSMGANGRSYEATFLLLNEGKWVRNVVYHAILITTLTLDSELGKAVLVQA
jgi:hypothetical protein